MANVNPVKQARVRELHEGGMSPNVIAANVDLSLPVVKQILGLSDAADRPVRKPQARTASTRGEKSAVFKDWEQADYLRFVEFWQQTPNYEKAADAEGLNVEQVKYLLHRLKAKGVALRRPVATTVIGIDFGALKVRAAELLPELERQALQAMRERGRKNLKKGK